MARKKAIRKDIGVLFLGMMAANHITTEELARKIGTSQATLSRRLADPSTFTLGEIVKIASEFEVSVEDAKPFLW